MEKGNSGGVTMTLIGGGSDILLPEGIRSDGRRPGELRQIQVKLGVFRDAEGSAYLEQGNTKILAYVYGPREAELRSMSQVDKATISVDYSVANFSTTERGAGGNRFGGVSSGSGKAPKDRKSQEAAYFIQKTLSTTLCLDLYARSQIDVVVQVLQSDGGTLAASINASMLAIIDAGIAVKDFVCASTVAFYKNVALLDVNHVEESMDLPVFSVAIQSRNNRICMAQSNRVFEEVSLACARIFQVFDKVVKTRTSDLLNKRQTSIV